MISSQLKSFFQSKCFYMNSYKILKMYYKYLFFLFAFTLSFTSISGQKIHSSKKDTNPIKDRLSFRQIITDSLFDSKQIISILSVKKNSLYHKLKLAYSANKLKTTSEFANENNAEAAINGGFFNVDKGGSVTYLEINDSIINRNISKKNKWGKPKNLMNGVVIFDKNDSLIIDFAKQEPFYEKSHNEKSVLVAGPVLIYNSNPVEMPELKFVNKRHPRTCICTTADSIVLVTIDGRSKIAYGMTLHEVQDFLQNLHCINAINLDGGGSTTMWIKHLGIVNHPSDKEGERPVANTFLITR